MWSQKWGTMIWGRATSAVPSTTFWTLLLLGAVLGVVGMRALRGARPRTLALTGLAVALLTPIAARALPTVNTFTNGTVADANQVNANFAAVTKLTVNGTSYSVGATKYCASTASHFDGASIGGYAGAKATCQTTCGSPTAHMCSPDEMVRSAQLGAVAFPGGWISTGVAATVGAPGDCNGWTDSTSIAGVSWTTQGPLLLSCANSLAIACCD